MRQIKKYILFAIAVIIISGCGASTGVFSSGKDTFTIIESGSPGFTYPTLGTLKKRAYTNANAYCEQQGKVMQPIAAETIDAHTSRFELQFLALDPNDPEVSRPILEPTADTKIDVKVH